jgi:hypothetical protein
MNTPILSAFYFGSVEHYRLLARHPKVIMDIGEHYERQSYRTRTSIVGPNGRQDLVVPIDRKSGEKMPMRTVVPSYVESWPQQHLHAIRSAYGNSPWYIHYKDDMEAVLLQRHHRLVDLDLATMRLGLKWLGLATEVEVSDTYVEPNSGTAFAAPPDDRPWSDLRSSFHPKRPLPPETTPVPSYPQVFADRHGFLARLSIIDLLCNCGPQARLSLLH